MNKNSIIYYEDELNEEFSEAVIVPRTVDATYVYHHKSLLWETLTFCIQNIFSIPIKFLYLKLKFKHQYIGKEKLKGYQGKGYFVYANHTQAFADTFITSMAMYPYKTNFLIVNPENVSIKGLGNFTQMLGAIPIPTNRNGMKNFLAEVRRRIGQGKGITIYPEAHIWPYYTKIRPFKNVSFRYPIELDVPSFCITNTYQAYGKNKDKVKMVSYVDGPFFAKETGGMQEKKEDLRNQIYEKMVERSKNSNFEYVKYIKKSAAGDTSSARDTLSKRDTSA